MTYFAVFTVIKKKIFGYGCAQKKYECENN